MPKRTVPDDERTLEMPKQTPDMQTREMRSREMRARNPDASSTRHRAKSSTPVRTPKKRHPRRRRDWNPVIRRVAAAVFAVELGLIVFANPYLRVTRVNVEGTQTLSPTQVFDEARVPPHTNIFWMALHQPFAKRLTADPVVDHAARRIKLPNTLILQVWERQPYATLALDGHFWLLDAHGVPFRTLTEPYPGLPVVAPQTRKIQGQVLGPDNVALGTPLRTDWLKHSYQLIALTAPDQNLAAMKIEVDQNGNLCLNRKDNFRILLGQADALPQKIELAQAAITAHGGQINQTAAYIDVSCPEQPAYMQRPTAGDREERD
jgi:cell division septal protein FtsQ